MRNYKQDWLIKEKRRKKPVTNTNNEKGDFITDPTDIKRVIREYCEKLYKSIPLGKMDKFLEKHLTKITK